MKIREIKGFIVLENTHDKTQKMEDIRNKANTDFECFINCRISNDNFNRLRKLRQTTNLTNHKIINMIMDEYFKAFPIN